MQRARARAQVGEGVRQVEQAGGDGDEPEVGEDVDDVAGEHERHAGEQQPERRHLRPGTGSRTMRSVTTTMKMDIEG